MTSVSCRRFVSCTIAVSVTSNGQRKADPAGAQQIQNRGAETHAAMIVLRVTEDWKSTCKKRCTTGKLSFAGLSCVEKLVPCIAIYVTGGR